MRRYKPFAPLLALLCIYTIYYLLEARSQPVVTMVDYWLHLQWARQLTLSNLETWVILSIPLAISSGYELGWRSVLMSCVMVNSYH